MNSNINSTLSRGCKIALEAKDLACLTLPPNEVVNPETVKHHVDQIVKTDAVKKKSVKVKLVNSTVVIGQRTSFDASQVKHFYSFLDSPGLLVLETPTALQVLKFKHQGDLEAFSEYVDAARGPRYTALPSLTASHINGRHEEPIMTTTARPLDRLQRVISLPTENEIRMPNDGVVDTREYYTTHNNNFTLRDNDDAIRRNQYYSSEAWVSPVMASKTRASLPVQPRSPTRVVAGPSEYRTSYDHRVIDTEILDDSPIINRRHYNGVASTSFISTLPHKRSSSNYYSPHSTRTMTLGGQKRWIEESKRLTYNSRTRRMEEDDNGEIMWFVAHEVPIEEETSY